MDVFDRALQEMRADALIEREMRPASPAPRLEAVLREAAYEAGILPRPYEADCGV